MATAWTSNKFNWACLFHDIPCVAGMPEIEIYAHRTSTISARWLRISWAEKRVTFLQVPSWIARIFVSQHKMFSARARLGWSFLKKIPEFRILLNCEALYNHYTMILRGLIDQKLTIEHHLTVPDPSQVTTWRSSKPHTTVEKGRSRWRNVARVLTGWGFASNLKM